MIVLDTHALVWWLGEPGRLPSNAAAGIERAAAAGALHVSSITAWELALLVQRGRLDLGEPLDGWLADCEVLPFLHFVPVNNTIALRSVRLPPPLHRDPADRIIVATALELGAELVTGDAKLHRYPYVDTVW